MDFVVLLSVFAITLTQVIARSYIDNQTKDGRSQLQSTPDTTSELSSESLPCDSVYDNLSTDSSEDGNILKFKLPTVITINFTMDIKGTLDMSHETFTVLFPIDEKEDYIKLVHNFKNNTLEGISDIDNRQLFYTIDDECKAKDTVEFYLNVQAKMNMNNGQQFLAIKFEDCNRSSANILLLKTDNFSTIKHIVFTEGIHKINSLMFSFEDD